MFDLNFFDKNKNSASRISEGVAFFLVVVTPLFYLSIDHWITNTSVIACLFILLACKLNKYNLIPWKDKNICGIIIFSSIYVIAILVSQLGRSFFNYRELLDQNRWIIALPFFIYIYSRKLDYAQVLDWVLPSCVLLSFLSSTYLIPSNAWGERYTISFMDPLAYGFINLALAMYCFASALTDLKSKANSVNSIFKFLAALVGVYISIRTGSRSGWFAVPIVFVFLVFNLYQNMKIKLCLYLILALASLVLVYFVSPTVNSRMNLLVHEVIAYPWSGGIAPETSIGLRITFYRLGAYYFSQSPLFGWGLRGFESIKDDPQVAIFATTFARDFAMGALFHSEWMTQAVQFGILGLLGVLYVFLFPLTLFYRYRHSNFICQKIFLAGSSYIVVMVVASIGDEVFHSKGMITFYAVIVSGLMATLLVRKKNEEAGNYCRV